MLVVFPMFPLILYVVLIQTCTFVNAKVSDVPQADRSALCALYDSTHGSTWSHNLNWCTNVTVCAWYGVTCTYVDQGWRVQKLDLSGNTLAGLLPTNWPVNTQSVGDKTAPSPSPLSQLTVLRLFGHLLTGVLPLLSVMPLLEEVYLFGCSFTGPIPSFKQNTKLQTLDLSYNALAGQLQDDWLQGLTQLSYLSISNNPIGGYFPSPYGCVSLFWLSLSGCGFHGTFPSLTMLPQLNRVDLDNNLFSGLFPDLSANINLWTINAGTNYFQGALPSFPLHLKYLDLSWNYFSGPLPVLMYALPFLQDLNLGYNMLSGDVDDFYNDTNLALLDLRCNHFDSIAKQSRSFITYNITCANQNNGGGKNMCNMYCARTIASSSTAAVHSSSSSPFSSSSSSTGGASITDNLSHSIITWQGVMVGVACCVGIFIAVYVGVKYIRKRRRTQDQYHSIINA